MNCRHCGRGLQHVFLDLGNAPPSNAYVSEAGLRAPEVYYPLRLFVCEGCWLVQTEDYAHADELFKEDYAYFSSVSRSWVDHAQRFSAMAAERLRLGAGSLVLEVAANDGYLLKNFVAAGIPCLGIEPTASTADAARAIGIPILQEFFGAALGSRLAQQGRKADLIVCNNVFAHVPDINDFSAGLRNALKPDGTVTIEFPHLLRLIEQVQFDTVYHEHFSYLSLHSARSVLAAAGLRVYDVEQLPTHGGSLRVYACHAGAGLATTQAVERLLAEEEQRGLLRLSTYAAFQPAADAVKDGLLRFLLESKRDGLRVAGYGAAAKGNTLLNYAGVRPDLLPFICDAAGSKQGKYTPGTHIPILHPGELARRRPDVVLILPWNIAPEVMQQQAVVRDWGGRFAVAVPRVVLS
ncbi:MAG TPA: class I SAM-dependent methyltransferase [Ramlibacter sp.]|nr:class I SAM-dependent methyltransferase [Ramlibacter sp.]